MLNLNYLSKDELNNYLKTNKKVCYIDPDENIAICGILDSVNDTYSKLLRDDAKRFNTMFYDPSILENNKDISIRHYWYKDKFNTLNPSKLNIINVDEETKKLYIIPDNIENPHLYQLKKIEEYMSKLGRNDVHIVYPLTKTENMSLLKGMKLALKYTKSTDSEAGFYYNTKTKKIVSPIVSSKNNNYQAPTTRSLIKDLSIPIGDFHTHPTYRFEDKYNDSCLFSKDDLITYKSNNTSEALLGCKNNIIIKLPIKKIPNDEYTNIIDNVAYSDTKKISDFVSKYTTSKEIQINKKPIIFYNNKHLQ